MIDREKTKGKEVNICVNNAVNPDYDYYTLEKHASNVPYRLPFELQQYLEAIHRDALLKSRWYLAMNVFSDVSGLEDSPGLRLQDLGREKISDIPECDRDLTIRDDGGLFVIPPAGIPGPPPKD